MRPGVPFEVYHFDKANLDGKILEEIYQHKERGDEAAYKKLFFETLPKKLNFSQNELDLQLEKANLLRLIKM
jgi:hypothetical protein